MYVGSIIYVVDLSNKSGQMWGGGGGRQSIVCSLMNLWYYKSFPLSGCIGLKQFLEESENKLQAVFDSACGFWNIHSFLLEQIEYRINDVASMRITAGKLLDTAIDLSSTGKPANIIMYL